MNQNFPGGFVYVLTFKAFTYSNEFYTPRLTLREYANQLVYRDHFKKHNKFIPRMFESFCRRFQHVRVQITQFDYRFLQEQTVLHLKVIQVSDI